MERLDKVISNQIGYSRKEVKDLVKQKRITINGDVALKSDVKVDVLVDKIFVDGEEVSFKKYVYLMLNKPKGYVSATEDKNMPTVLELVPEEYLHRDLFPAGRLDRDTTGLMLITDDGEFAHNILSPKKHVKKTYNVTIDIPMTEDMVIGFKNGVNLIDGECKEAELTITSEYTGVVVLTEGRYHQIKRMFGCFGAKVTKLHRVQMGCLTLPEDLEKGMSRELTKEELELITKR
jgi:16S rRNA pseudouridine516 synthase